MEAKWKLAYKRVNGIAMCRSSGRFEFTKERGAEVSYQEEIQTRIRRRYRLLENTTVDEWTVDGKQYIEGPRSELMRHISDEVGYVENCSGGPQNCSRPAAKLI